jgi:hypothetical protein
MAERVASLLCLLFLSSVKLAAQFVVLPSPNHDFGTVKQGARLEHTFTLRNGTPSSVQIDRIDFSAKGITTRFKPAIRHGAETEISLAWDTTQANGNVEVTALVHLNDEHQTEIALELHAKVKPPVEFSPYPAVFFTAYQDETVEKRVTIINNEEVPLLLELAEFPNEHYQVDLVTVDAGNIYELRVKVRPGIPYGRYTELIVLRTNRSHKPRMQVAANLFVKPNFYAFPETLDFGVVNLDRLERQPELLELLTQNTILTSRFGPVEIRAIQTELLFLRISQTPANGPVDRFRINVGLSHEKLQKGIIAGSLRIVTSDPTLPELTIPVTGQVN